MNQLCIVVALLFALVLNASVNAECQTAPTVDTTNTLSRNTVYAEIGTALLVGCVSMNYERLLTEHLALRTGLGLGYYADYGNKDTDVGYGTMIMMNYFTSESDYKFEIGVGGSLMYFNTGFSGGDVMDGIEPGTFKILPAIALGYRYQQRGGGFFFRTGLSFTYFMSTPVQVSFGYTF